MRDKTRPSRIPPTPLETIDRVLALTNTDPPHEATHYAERRIMPHGRADVLVGVARPGGGSA